MHYYFAGGEVPSHRNLLASVGAEHIALSYMGLRRRVKFARPWVIEEKIAGAYLKANPEFDPSLVQIFLDSGAFSVNSKDNTHSIRELLDINEHYQDFVAQNIDRLTMVSEFDVLALGREWIEEQRSEFYDDLPPEKFMPIWHVDWGLDSLRDLAQRYTRVGVPSTSLGGRNLAPFLNSIVAETGVLLHGVAMTQVDEMQAIKWATVSSTSWVSPQQYGDTIVWTGNELKRYPKKYKDQARKRYRTLFEREGFNSEAIENDDDKELLRLSVWSWQQLVSDIDKKQGRHLEVVTNPEDEADSPFAEFEGVTVDNPPAEERKSVATVRQRATSRLPVMGLATTTTTETDPETGEEVTKEVEKVGIRSESTRLCTSCYLASKCPAFEAGSNCAYNIPVEIKTRDQFQAIQNSLIEMQTQRVMFMRFAEETEGGYADPNLSSEMDRLQKMLKVKHEMEQDGFTVKFEAKGTGQYGQPGTIARLFGEKASEAARGLPAPQEADIHVEQVLEGESTYVPGYDQ